MEINEDSLAEDYARILKDISIPRHVGTENEKKVIEYLIEQSESFQIPTKVEEFPVSQSFMHIFNRLPYFLMGIAIVVISLLSGIAFNPVLGLVFGTILFVFAFTSEGIIRYFKYKVMYSFGRQFTSKNIMGLATTLSL